jgi:hypothetical protein
MSEGAASSRSVRILLKELDISDEPVRALGTYVTLTAQHDSQQI